MPASGPASMLEGAASGSPVHARSTLLLTPFKVTSPPMGEQFTAYTNEAKRNSLRPWCHNRSFCAQVPVSMAMHGKQQTMHSAYCSLYNSFTVARHHHCCQEGQHSIALGCTGLSHCDRLTLLARNPLFHAPSQVMLDSESTQGFLQSNQVLALVLQSSLQHLEGGIQHFPDPLNMIVVT